MSFDKYDFKNEFQPDNNLNEVHVPMDINQSRVKSGKFERSAKFRQRPCLFHILIFVIRNKLD